MCDMQVLFLLLLSLGAMLNGSLGGLMEGNEEECTCRNSYLWKVEAEPPIYLYGTLHVPYTKLWSRIPINQKTAFSASGSLLMELELTDPITLKRLSDCQYLPKGDNLRSILPIHLYERIEKYLERMKELFLIWLRRNSGSSIFLQQTRDKLYNGITHNWDKRRPIWLLYLLDSLTENMIQFRSTPVFDTFLDNVANKLNKKTGAIENVADHCRPLNKLKQDEVIIALRKKLDYLEPLAMEADGPPSGEDNYVRTYFCGDFENLVQTTSILPLPKLSNMTNLTVYEAQAITNMNTYLKKQIVFRRNRKMTRTIIKMLEDKTRNETSFFAVGAGHFLGRKSIVDLLQKRNYTVTRLSTEQHIDGPELPEDIVALGDPSSVPRILKITKEITTPPPSFETLPPLTQEEISDIFQEIFNNSKTYEADSAEVSATPSTVSSSSTLTPSPSPLTPVSQTAPSQQQPSYITSQSGIVVAMEENEITQLDTPDSASSTRLNIIFTSMLAIISVTIFTKLL